MDLLRVLAFALVALCIWVMTPLEPPPPSGLARPGLFIAVVLAALAVGIAEVFRDSAAQTILPSVVPKDRLEWANGRLWSVELTGNSLVGPAIGTFLIAIAPFVPFALNGACYAMAALLMSQLSGRFNASLRKTRDWRKEIGEGFAFLNNAPLLRLLAYVTGAWNLLFQMVFVALFCTLKKTSGSEQARSVSSLLSVRSAGS